MPSVRLYRPIAFIPPAWPPPADEASVFETLDYARQRDPLGHGTHVALAALHLIMLPLAHAPGAISFGILVTYAAMRLPATWRCYSALLRQPLLWLMILFVAWFSLSVLWSADKAEGLDEMGALRMLMLPLVLWPVLDRAVLLVGAALLGIFAQNLVQFGQHFEVFGLESQSSGRIRGMLHPIQTGAWCAAAMCWHLSALLHGSRWIRVISCLGLFAALVGLVISGSRGPWIALLAVVPAGLALIAWRRGKLREGALAAGLLAAAVLASVTIKADYVQQRIDAARSELRSAVENQDYTTSVGLRIGMWSWALEITGKSPWIGTGAGSFRVEAGQLQSHQTALERWPQRERLLNTSQPHSSHLQMLQATGIIGLMIFWSLLGYIIVQAWRDRHDHFYVDGTLLVILVWIVAAQFDSFHLSGTSFGMLTFAAAVSMRHRLPAAGSAAAAPAGETNA